MKRVRLNLIVLAVLAGGYGHSAEPVFTSSLGTGFVEIPRTPILMAQWEVRVKDFKAFLDETGFQWEGRAHFEQSGDHPVVGISRSDANVFCQWLTEKERAAGKLGAGQKFRLPTDYEWSCAAGLRNVAADSPALERKLEADGHFVWGGAWPPVANSGNFNSRSIEGYDDPFDFTAPVGSFLPSDEGVYDLAGNVWEWTAASEDQAKGTGVLRGGAFVYFRRDNLLAAYRYQVDETARESTFGFRLVLEDKERNEAFLRGESAARESGSEALQSNLLPPEMSELTNGNAENPGESSLPGVLPVSGKAHSNSLGMKFVPVGGLDQILVGQTEVRLRDFNAFVEAKGIPWPTKPKYAQTSDHAVASMPFSMAESFCEWLTASEREAGVLGAFQSYRLPTDTEWSQMAGLVSESGSSPAARDANGDGQGGFPWGDQWPPPPDAGNFESASIPGYSENTPYTSVVATFQADANGLFDLSGNVSEWVTDRWLPGADDYVARGGSWIDYERSSLQTSKRKKIARGAARGNVGFRCVLAVGGK